MSTLKIKDRVIISSLKSNDVNDVRISFFINSLQHIYNKSFSIPDLSDKIKEHFKTDVSIKRMKSFYATKHEERIKASEVKEINY